MCSSDLKIFREISRRFSRIVSNITRTWANRHCQDVSRLVKNKYILVLLQWQPEQTTSVSARDTPFEEERILELARRFPDYQIIAREHPSTSHTHTNFFQYRSRLFFQRLKKILRSAIAYQEAELIIYLWLSILISQY